MASILRHRRNLNQIKGFVVIKKVQTKLFLQLIDNYVAYEKYRMDYGMRTLKEIYLEKRE